MSPAIVSDTGAIVRTRQTAVLCYLLVALLCGCTRSPAPDVVFHVVVCWLKEPNNHTARRELIEVSETFSQIPGVLNVAAGTSLPSPRKIVDSSFDVAIIIQLRDKEALAAYLDHPIHRRAAKEVLQPLTDRVVVYDMTR